MGLLLSFLSLSMLCRFLGGLCLPSMMMLGRDTEKVRVIFGRYIVPRCQSMAKGWKINQKY